MKNILFAFIIPLFAVALTSCKKDNTIISVVPESPRPVSGFSYTSEYLVVTFTNTSTDAKTYYWEFGDGATSSEMSPVHTYTSTGNYDVVLKVNSAAGYSDTERQTIFVAGHVEASFTYAAGLGLQINFDAAGSVNIQTAVWDFGDGSAQVTGITAAHIFPAAGTYNVTLTVTGLSGDMVTKTVPVTVVDNRTVMNIVDKNATAETKALYSQLWAIQSVGAMFGHHDDLWYGREWRDVAGRSDVKEVCGDFPAVFSVDFAEIMDDRALTGTSIRWNEVRRRCIIEAYGRGEVTMACIHINNPLTGGDAWDNSNNNVVRQILTEGSPTNVKYKGWLDRVADFANNLKDPSGTLIPILFRPYHEHTQTWSWWGSQCTTQSDFIAFWRYTIEYLRDTKNVHNFLYAISPQMDSVLPKEQLLFRWPGDDYVDFLGMDCYHGTYTQAYNSNLKNIIAISEEKKIPCGVTETGIEGIRINNQPYAEYWTEQMLAPLNQLRNATGKTVSMVVMWRNEYDPYSTGYHYFGPYIKHPSAANFVEFYNSPVTLFSKDLPNMYQLSPAVIVQ